jgi:hypothetical protein
VYIAFSFKGLPFKGSTLKSVEYDFVSTLNTLLLYYNVSVERREVHGLLTSNQLFSSMVDAGVPSDVASSVTRHEAGHERAFRRAEGVDGKGVSGSSSMGFYFANDGRRYNLTAYFEPKDWGELSWKDIEDIALDNYDPSPADLNTARMARGNRLKQEEKEKKERIYLRNEVEIKVIDAFKEGDEVTYESIADKFGGLAERNKDFIEKAIEKAKKKAKMNEQSEKELGIKTKPIKGTVLTLEDTSPIPEVEERSNRSKKVDNCEDEAGKEEVVVYQAGLEKSVRK